MNKNNIKIISITMAYFILNFSTNGHINLCEYIYI